MFANYLTAARRFYEGPGLSSKQARATRVAAA